MMLLLRMGMGRLRKFLGKFPRRETRCCCCLYKVRPYHRHLTDLNFSRRLLRPMVRSLVSAFPQVRGSVSRSRTRRARAHRSIHLELKPSIIASLRPPANRLWSMSSRFHEPTLNEVADDRIFEELERLTRGGFDQDIFDCGISKQWSLLRSRLLD